MRAGGAYLEDLARPGGQEEILNCRQMIWWIGIGQGNDGSIRYLAQEGCGGSRSRTGSFKCGPMG